jgi:4-amino-4-deoxy-L-arabinose transferase-like glycosyltransferase
LTRFIQPDLPLVWLTRSRLSPYAWIVILWALLILPAVFLVGAHFGEGTTLGFARGAFEDGHWLVPHLYGMRSAARPVLVSSVLGLIGLAVGDFDLWVGRIPAVSALLGGGVLIYWFARRAVGAQGAIFATACFLLSPLIIQKLITAENDGVVSVLLFAAFVVWWIGAARGGPTPARWLVVGAVLAVAGLVKGPQPLGFFFLGVGSYLMARRRWQEVAGLVLAGLVPAVVVGGWYWLVHEPSDGMSWLGPPGAGVPSPTAYALHLVRFTGQIAAELLPGLILVAPLVVDVGRRRIEANRELALALLSYAAAGTLFVLLLPGTRTPLAMPMVPAVAVLAGIAFHHFLTRLPRLVLFTQFLAGGLLLYVLVLNWLAMSLFPAAFNRDADEAEPLVAAILERPAPVYVVPNAVNLNVVFYLPKPRLVGIDEMARAKPPYWAIVTPGSEAALRAARPDVEASLRLEIPKAGARLIEVKKP